LVDRATTVVGTILTSMAFSLFTVQYAKMSTDPCTDGKLIIVPSSRIVRNVPVSTVRNRRLAQLPSQRQNFEFFVCLKSVLGKKRHVFGDVRLPSLPNGLIIVTASGMSWK